MLLQSAREAEEGGIFTKYPHCTTRSSQLYHGERGELTSIATVVGSGCLREHYQQGGDHEVSIPERLHPVVDGVCAEGAYAVVVGGR